MNEWMAFYNLEPWGTEREDWRAAMLATTVVNFSGHVKQPKKIKDFMPIRRTRQSVKEQLIISKMVFGE